MPKTRFDPCVHGFAFTNRWMLDPQEIAEIRTKLKQATSLADMLMRLFPQNPLLWLAVQRLKPALMTWIDQALVEPHGLCGGMAFAALDYYYAQRPPPRGTGPDNIPTPDLPQGRVLHDYLRQRLLDSLAANALTFLTWMAFLHRIPDQSPLGGGARWLGKQSKAQWQMLKKRIDVGQPCVLGLVGTTQDPTVNHQVVAFAYDATQDGAGTIYVYDMNYPGREISIGIRFVDEKLEADEGNPHPCRGRLCGFFCERYQKNPNPPAIAWP